MEQFFAEYREKRTTLRGMHKVSKISYREFPFYVSFLLEFLEFSVEWYALKSFNNCWIFRKLSEEICLRLESSEMFA